MSDDFYDRRANGVREPDPTLGRRVRPQRPLPQPSEQAVVESLPPAPENEPAPKPDHHARPKRERVILNDPRRGSGTLRARVELEEQTSWGKLLVKDHLVKVQLRTAMLLAGLVVVVFGSLPVLFYFLPGFSRLSVVGIPVAWLILGVLPFPFLFGVGIWYNRLAERNERAFVDMIEN
ncbi:hypothetical protein Amsp01_025640 [Amycolatopsis sp. NBRC 101858]|uniref:hypothetical protein n=1 Tax=Amycolatopsis sp. NBRC 101858 TaxID=3032200 RepID=UPI0024A5A726|nr:hypothetical protein [Amycolatopsis sp. NBRC 101858]GLY36540.1 hypothetical protein Amsp01_025640 [Amycolatopsis sp. NBRC 101858]